MEYRTVVVLVVAVLVTARVVIFASREKRVGRNEPPQQFNHETHSKPESMVRQYILCSLYAIPVAFYYKKLELLTPEVEVVVGSK